MRRFFPCYDPRAGTLVGRLPLLALLWPLAMNSQPQPPPVYFFSVPNDLMTVDGNTNSKVPFAVLGPVRYQQVYEAAQFSQVPAGGAFLIAVFLRADCTSIKNWRVTKLQVNASTVSIGPDQLTPTFSRNVGADDTRVFTSTTWAPPGICLPSNSFSGASVLHLEVPFFYDPAKGNLLLDLRSSGIDWNGAPLYESSLDAHDVLGDSVSRALAFSLGSDTAEVVDTVGLVTAFEFRQTPTLYVRSETNAVVLYWPTHPEPFRLQWSETAGPRDSWSDYPGPIAGNNVWQELVLPAGSLTSRKFFRLFWNTPQPLPTPPASPPVPVDPVIKP